MTLNWGHKLVIVFLVFGGLMGTLIYRSVKTNFDLVSKEYYKEELAYQQVIDGTARANRLSGSTSVLQDGGFVVLRLPQEMKNAAVTGTAWFYYAPDATKDRKFALELDEQAEQKFPANVLAAGKYRVKIAWEYNKEQYYTEQSINIQ